MRAFNVALCAGNFENYLLTIEEILEFDAELFVCGHLNKVGTRTDVLQGHEFAEDVKQAAAVRFVSCDVPILFSFPTVLCPKTPESFCFQTLDHEEEQ